MRIGTDELIILLLILLSIGLPMMSIFLPSGIIGSMIKAPFDVSRNRYYLYLRKYGKRTTSTRIFEGFDNFIQLALVAGWRELLICWLPIVIEVAAGILAIVFILSTAVAFGVLILIVGMLAGCVVHIYKELQYWPMAWIQADHPNMKAKDVSQLSKEMTEGHIADLLVYDLSFIGWMILNQITGGIAGLLYVSPYYQMTCALVYEELKGCPIDLDSMSKPQPCPGPGLPQGEPKLLGIAGMYKGSSIPLTPDQPVTLGRDANSSQIVFTQGAEKISRRHCFVAFDSKEECYKVTDVSSNGTYVDGKRLPENTMVALKRGTEIALGDSSNIIRLV